MLKEYQHRVAIFATACWVIVMPFVWAYILSWRIGCDYSDVLAFYRPEFAIGALCVILLPAAWMRKRWAVVGLLVAALLVPALKGVLGSPTAVAWVISVALLLLVAWGTYSCVPDQGSETKRVAVRGLLILAYGLMAIGTPSAYMYWTAGVLAGIQGVEKGRHLLGVLLSTLSLLALFAVWTLWSIGKRMWIHCAYVESVYGSRSKDALGLLCAWIVLAGFAAMSRLLYRVDEVVVFSVLLAPAVVLATVAFLWSKSQERTDHASDSQERARPAPVIGSATMKLAHLPGVLCGVAIAGLGIAFFVPRPVSGWGPCTWSVIFPVSGALWPTERPVIFDACDDGLMYLTFVCAALSAVCLIAGAFAATIGKQVEPRRGALATAIVVAAILVKLALSEKYLELLPTLVVGIAAVAGVAWLGYLGGHLGVLGSQPGRKWGLANEKIRVP